MLFRSTAPNGEELGRDISKQLVGLMRKLAGKTDRSIAEFKAEVRSWYNSNYDTLMKRRGNEKKLEQLNDRHNCIAVFAEGKFENAAGAIQACDNLFSDKVSSGVTCSTVHRAKGLEAERVFVLYPEDMPHPMAKTQEDRQQEKNIEYVAITRSKRDLIFVKRPERNQFEE